MCVFVNRLNKPSAWNLGFCLFIEALFPLDFNVTSHRNLDYCVQTSHDSNIQVAQGFSHAAMTEVVFSFSDLHIINDILSICNGSYVHCTPTYWQHFSRPSKALSIFQVAKKRTEVLMFTKRKNCSIKKIKFATFVFNS